MPSLSSQVLAEVHFQRPTLDSASYTRIGVLAGSWYGSTSTNWDETPSFRRGLRTVTHSFSCADAPVRAR